MLKISINLAQLRELQGKLEPGKFTKAVDIALFRIGNEMESIAKELVPWDTGTLSRSITMEGVMSGERVIVGTDVIYAAIHEFGGLTGRNHSVRIRPTPYLRPALNKMEKGRAVEIITEEINKILE